MRCNDGSHRIQIGHGKFNAFQLEFLINFRNTLQVGMLLERVSPRLYQQQDFLLNFDRGVVFRCCRSTKSKR